MHLSLCVMKTRVGAHLLSGIRNKTFSNKTMKLQWVHCKYLAAKSFTGKDHLKGLHWEVINVCCFTGISIAHTKKTRML